MRRGNHARETPMTSPSHPAKTCGPAESLTAEQRLNPAALELGKVAVGVRRLPANLKDVDRQEPTPGGEGSSNRNPILRLRSSRTAIMSPGHQAPLGIWMAETLEMVERKSASSESCLGLSGVIADDAHETVVARLGDGRAGHVGPRSRPSVRAEPRRDTPLLVLEKDGFCLIITQIPSLVSMTTPLPCPRCRGLLFGSTSLTFTPTKAPIPWPPASSSEVLDPRPCHRRQSRG